MQALYVSHPLVHTHRCNANFNKRLKLTTPLSLPTQSVNYYTSRVQTLKNSKPRQPTTIAFSLSYSNDKNSQELETEHPCSNWTPPQFVWRGVAVLILAGQVVVRTLKGKIHGKNTLQQLERVGPQSVGVCFLTSAFVGMAFTVQFVPVLTKLGLNRGIGGVLGLTFARELSPVVTSIVVVCRVGTAFAAEIGTMQVSEQIDTLRILRTDSVDYLVTPRVIASCIAVPILTLMSFTVGLALSALMADAAFGVNANVILESAGRALRPWDILGALVKSHVFGGIIAVVSCALGLTTTGGAKGVGDSTTSAAVVSVVGIIVADFFLSYLFFQGAGNPLKKCI